MTQEEEVNIKGFRLVLTCGACPEQYDVFKDGVEVGYLRLRHGCFTAEADGKLVYDAEPDGDGIFTQEEREKYLTAAVDAIARELESK